MTPNLLTSGVLVLLSFLGLSTAASANSCDRLQFFSRYRALGLLETAPNGFIRLHLTADLHQGDDCGTPDCYGTYIDLTLHVLHDGADCRLSSADAQLAYFTCPDGHPPLSRSHSGGHSVRLTVHPGPQALTAPGRLTLINDDEQIAIVILPETFYFFDNTKPGAELHTALPTSESSDNGCCWGATSSRLLQQGARLE